MTQEKNTSSNFDFEFISLSQIETPKFEISDQDQVLMFGENNRTPELLTGFLDRVPMHSAIIQKKTDLTMDGGLVDENGNYIDLMPNEFETINTFALKIITDFWVYGESYVKVAWERGGENPKTMEHITHDKVRLAIPENDVVKFAYVNEKYNNSMYEWDNFPILTQSNYVKYPLFNSTDKTQIQILHLKSYNTITQYGLPDYFSSIKDLDTLAQISTFHNANIHNNMQPGFKIIFEGAIPDKEKRDKITKKIQDKYSDAKNTGKPMLFWVPSGGQMTVEPFSTSDISKMYNLLSKEVKENILVAHQIPRKIAGIETAGSLGSSKEILELMDLFKVSVIKPMQQLILSYFNSFWGVDMKFKTNPINLLLRYNISELQNVLTQNEIRELMGYEPTKQINNE